MSTSPVDPQLIAGILSGVGITATLTWAAKGKDTASAAQTQTLPCFLFSATIKRGPDAYEKVTQAYLPATARNPVGATLALAGRSYTVAETQELVVNEHSLFQTVTLR